MLWSATLIWVTGASFWFKLCDSLLGSPLHFSCLHLIPSFTAETSGDLSVLPLTETAFRDFSGGFSSNQNLGEIPESFGAVHAGFAGSPPTLTLL
jgi:hypothetical protein